VYAIFVHILVNIMQFRVIEQFHFGKECCIVLWWKDAGATPHDRPSPSSVMLQVRLQSSWSWWPPNWSNTKYAMEAIPVNFPQHAS